ncbi:MAG: ABC transporter permease [Mangrovibacterium sp.]
MKRLLFILQKEFRQIFRDKTIIAMISFLPIMQLTLMPMAANFDVKSVNIACLDFDHSEYSRMLIEKITSSGYFNVTNEGSNQATIYDLERGKVDMYLEIPNGFERGLLRNGVQQVNITLDAINNTKSNIGGAYLLSVIEQFNQTMDINVKTSGVSNQSLKVIKTSTATWFNPLSEYKYFIVPAILVILLTIIGGFLSALNIVSEKEAGTIEQINVTPIKKWQFIVGKLVPFWVVGMIVFTVGLIIMWGIYGIFPEGSLFTLYAFAAVYLVALLGIGLLISTFSDTQQQAMFVSFFFIMIFILMGGLFTSIDSMPVWARQISLLTPVTHFISVMRLVVLKGSSFALVSHEFIVLCVFAIILNTAAILNYRKTS